MAGESPPCARTFARALLLATAAVLLCACSQLPSLQGRSATTALQDTAGTPLGLALQPALQAHPGLAGIVPLAGGLDAFAARVTLAQAAQRSLDLQYYIWHDDATGRMLFDALRAAADRGVRVRLLLDDNNTAGTEEVLGALDAHPRVEVRLFNPFLYRRLRALDFLTDFGRVNRRMHNKSFTADNQATIVGGRNIGDEYFDADAGLLFVDLDVLAVGPVVREVSADFDRYWASDSSYPLGRILPPADTVDVAPRKVDAGAARTYGEAVAQSSFVRDLLAGRLQFEWARVAMVSDDPAKGLGLTGPQDHLWNRLQRVTPAPVRELQLVSPYFVPTERGAEDLTAMARRGVEVSVLTNALEATDVAAVHAGYAPWRKPLVAAGVQLYELKRSSALPPVQQRTLAGSSSASLHAKTFAVDRQRIFVGSFNFDPRSARLNTELGFLIESRLLAGTLADRFASGIPERAYHLRLHEGELLWLEEGPEGTVAHGQEPNVSFWQRLGVRLLSKLPIEGLL